MKTFLKGCIVGACFLFPLGGLLAQTLPIGEKPIEIIALSPRINTVPKLPLPTSSTPNSITRVPVATPNTQLETLLSTPSSPLDSPNAGGISTKNNNISTENAKLATANTSTSTANLIPTAPSKIVKKKPIYTYQSSVRDGFTLPALQLSKYPNLNISGFHETKFAARDYNPKTATDSRLTTIQNDPFYSKLPREVLPGSPSLFFTYRFNIDGNLDKDLSVHYDIEQEPDLPGKYDIKINYKTTRLTFYHFDVKLVDGELISIRKALNGAMFQSYTDDWETTIAFGKLRSQPNKYSAYGNGTNKISLGVGSILEDSLQVWVNNNPQNRGADFDVDFYKGEITFKSIKSQTDFIVVVYEFTNKIEDFIPSLSRKNFVGGQFLWRSKIQARENKLVKCIVDESLKPKGATPNSEYFTKNKPILLSSETIKFNNRILRRNIDYFIKPLKGRISFPDKFIQSPRDTLTISYDYYDTEQVSEEIIAKNSPGPYSLSRHNLIEGSTTVFVDDAPMREAVDYFVDEGAGKISFSYPVGYGSVIAVQYTSIKSVIETPTKNNAPLSLGVTYASEYVPPQQNDPIAKVTSESATVTGNLIYATQFTPIQTTGITISVGGKTLDPSQFEILNAYKGQIRITSLPSGVSLPSTVLTSYSYTKSFKTTRAFQLKQVNGNKTYTNPYDFEIQDLPVKFRGVQEIQLGSFKLSSGNEFIIDYGENGQNITIKFLTQSENRGSLLAAQPSPSDILTMIYDYTPLNQQQQGVLSQQMIGVTATNKWNENWSSHAEILVSDHNFSKPEEFFTKDLKGTGVSGDTYDFGVPNLVENSEAVYLINDQKVIRRINRDSDYVINYTLGRVRLLHDTPGSLDNIRIEARYFKNDNTTAGAHKTKTATKLATQYKSADLTVNGDFKFIDKDFLPIGDFLETKGTTVYGVNADWRMAPKTKFTGDYHHRDTFSGQSKDTNIPLYTRNDEITVGAKIEDVIDTINTEHNFHLLTSVQDPDNSASVPSNNHRAIDEQTFDYTGRVSHVLDNILTNYTTGFSQKTTDFLDRANRSIISTQRNRIDNSSSFDKIWALGLVKVGPYLEIARDQIDQFSPSVSTLNKTENLKRSYTDRTYYGTTASADPMPNLNFSLNYGVTQITSKGESKPTENFQRLLNALYEASYRPAPWLGTRLSVLHNEDESPLTGQKGKLEDERRYQINQLSLRGLWNDLGVKEASSWWIWPIRDTNLTGSRSELSRRENNFLRKYDSIGNNYTVSGIEFIPGWNLASYSYSDFDSTNIIDEKTLVSSRNTTFLKQLSRSISTTYRPQIPLLNLFNYSFTMEDRLNKTLSTQESRTTSNSVDDQTPLFKRDQTLGYNLGKLELELPLLSRLNFGAIEAMAGEGIKIQTNRQFTTYYRGFDANSISSTNVSQDNIFSKYYSADLKYTPISILILGVSAKKANDIYSRNKIATIRGTALLDTRDLNLNATFAPFSWIKFGGASIFKRVEQYQSNQINKSLTELDSAYLANNFSGVLANYLLKNEYTYKGDATWFPWSFISFTGTGSVYKLTQIYADSAGKIQEEIKQKTIGGGTTFYPFPGFSTGYLYTLKFSSQKTTGQNSQGYDGTLTIKYTPVKTQNFEVNFTYDRVDTWGKDLNSLDQTSNQQGAGTVIQSSIVERADTVETATLKVDINIPFGRSSAILDRIVITGEGYLKKIADGMDYTKVQKRSYELSGLILKGTMMF